MKDIKVPAATGTIFWAIYSWEISFMARSWAPNIAGTDKRKEKLAACFFSNPKKRQVTMVEPDLEIPGKTAHPCTVPTIRAFFMHCVRESFCNGLSFANFEEARIAEVINSIIPVKNMFAKINSPYFLMIRPIIAVGTDPIMIISTIGKSLFSPLFIPLKSKHERKSFDTVLK